MANEKRLIGYDPILFGEFVQSLKNTLEVYDPYSDGYEDGIDRITDWLEFNFADAVEVVHGRWIVEVDGNFRNVKCSACGKDYACHTGMLQLQNLNYCPNCGAKMDGDGNG